MWRLIQSTLWETKLAINRSDQSRQQRCAGSASAHGTSQLHSRKTRRSGAAQKEFYSIRRLARSAASIADICNTNVTTTLYYTFFTYYISIVFHARTLTTFTHASVTVSDPGHSASPTRMRIAPLARPTAQHSFKSSTIIIRIQLFSSSR